MRNPCVATCLVLLAASLATATELEPIVVSADGKGFAYAESGQPFIAWGFNYDHDDTNRLIEDYWHEEWQRVADDFREMRELGANTVRVHLQFGRFMKSADEPNERELAQLARLVELAEEVGIYLDITGLGCYHKQDVPEWYHAMDEAARWQAQAAFWEAVARTCAGSPAIFCYDLMNEPVVPAGDKPQEHWLGPPLGDKHFVQYVSRDRAGRERHDVARAWCAQLVAAIRKHDREHLVTVGLVPWSLDRPNRLRSGFVPEAIAPELDFIAVHLYPKSGEVDEELETLAGFQVGKPVVVEETFFLNCSLEEYQQFFDAARGSTSGWISFYWGKTREQCRASDKLADKLMLAWLDWFVSETPALLDAESPSRDE